MLNNNTRKYNFPIIVKSLQQKRVNALILFLLISLTLRFYFQKKKRKTAKKLRVLQYD